MRKEGTKMERLTGIVMDKIGRHVILMTPKGEFKRVKISGRIPEIGEEVRIPVVHRHFFNMPKAGWLATAAAAILLLISSPLLTVIRQPAMITTVGKQVNTTQNVKATKEVSNSIAGKTQNSSTDNNERIAQNEKKIVKPAEVQPANENQPAVTAPVQQPVNTTKVAAAPVNANQDNKPTDTKPDITPNTEITQRPAAATIRTQPTVTVAPTATTTPNPGDPAASAADDQKTIDNYMGEENTVNPADNNDMYLVRPTF
jgi:hypothetical protein